MHQGSKEAPPGGDAYFAAAYHPYDRPTPTQPGFDGTFNPSGMETVPKCAAIALANRYMGGSQRISDCLCAAFSQQCVGFSGICPKIRKARDYYGYRIVKAISKVNINALWELKFFLKTDTILQKSGSWEHSP